MANLWMQKVKESMERKGTVGSFSRSAKQAGKSTSEYADDVMSSKKSTTKMKRKANLSKVFAKYRKGG